MELAFAGLHQLCGPMLDRLERLPAPQRQALEIVFGLSAGQRPGPVPRGPGGAEPGLGGGRRSAAAVRRRRRAVARPGVGADARVRRPSPAGRAGRDRLRRTRAGRGAPARSRAGGARRARRRRARAARLGGAVPARRAGPGSDHRRDAGQSAGAAGAAAGPDGDGAGGRLRAAGRAEPLGTDRGELRPAAPGALRRRAAAVAARGGGAARRSAAALARGREVRHRAGGRR